MKRILSDKAGRPNHETDLAFLLRATSRLSAALDVDETLAAIAKLSLPHIGAWCILDIFDGHEKQRVAIVHPDPVKQEIAKRLQNDWPLMRHDGLGVLSVQRKGPSRVVYPVTDAMLQATAHTPENLDVLRALDIGSFMTVPLVTAEGAIGAITHVSPNHGDSFSELDLALAENLAAKASLAVENSRLKRTAENALLAAQRSEERFSRIISIAAEAIISVDGEQRITLFNEGAEHIFGYSNEEILGQPLALLIPERARSVHAEHVKAFGDSPEVARRMGHRHEIAGRRKNGEEFPAEASISKFDVDGSRVYTVVLRDITEARKASIAMENLLRAVTDASEARSRLIRGVSHDVKNPLGAADGYAQLLEMELKGKLAAEQAKLVEGVRRGIKSALAIITDLLDLSRLKSGGLSIHRTTLNITDVVSQSIEDHRGAAEALGHSISLDPHGRPLSSSLVLESDPARIHEILGNLLSNAIKYTPDGGRITVRLEEKTDSAASRPGPWVAISVCDTGSGIPLDQRERIFAEFHRLDGPERPDGHGLGLAISRRIATLLGGEITVGGVPGEGSDFALWLPLTASIPA